MEKENKTYSMSIRVSEQELEKLKQAARLEAYASYSEFVRRTALIKADDVIKKIKKSRRHNRNDKCMREDVAQLVLVYGRRNCVCLL